MPFNYRPLTPNSNETRLVRLLPTAVTRQAIKRDAVNPELDLDLEMHHAGRNGTQYPVYDALSYTWREPSQGTRMIRVNNQQFEVRINLYEALMAIQREIDKAYALSNVGKRQAQQDYEGPARVQHPVDVFIWVDALCINQDDVEEKTQQVRRMRDIYTAADSVIVWLGIETCTTGRAFQFIKEVHDCLHADRIICEDRPESQVVRSVMRSSTVKKFLRGKRSTGNTVDLLKTLLGRKGIEADITALTILLLNPYWKRLWVVQEYISGRHVYIRQGRHVMPAKQFEEVQFALSTGHGSDLLAGKFVRLMDKVYKDPNSNIAAFELTTSGVTAFKYLREGLQAWEASEGFLVFMRSNIGRLAAEPKDSIFALAALMNAYIPRSEMQITVDYSRTLSQIYTDFVKKEIHHTRRLDILLYSDGRISHDESTPSWAIEWHNLSLQHTWITPDLDPSTLWGSARTSSAMFSFPNDDKTIKVQALILGRVDSVSAKVMTSVDAPDEELIQEFHQWIPLMLCMSEDGLTQMEALGEIMAGEAGWNLGRGEVARRCWRAFSGALITASEKMCPEKKFEKHHKLAKKDFLQVKLVNPLLMVRRMMWDRVLIESSDAKSVGRAPAAARVGDILSVPYGCAGTILLRPLGDGSYRVIGPCVLRSMVWNVAFNRTAQDILLR